MKHLFTLFFVMLSFVASAQVSSATYQNNLSKLVTYEAKQQTVRTALQEISSAGNFYFSFNGKLINQDSLINVNVQRMPVREVLDKMFDGKVDYKENNEYVFLRYAVNHLTIQPENITTAENLYLISGHVVDTQTGKRVKKASVYEKRLLQSTLTDDEGNFTLRFKGDVKEVILTASKETYRDTSLVFLSDIKIEPQKYDDPDKEKGTFFSNFIEDLGIGKFFLSSRQRVSNLNIPNFFANTPFQASLLPGLSSHGMMSSRIVNKVSLNVLGGYTAGVEGVEVAGLFNLSIGKVKSFQAAGLFNVVGGTVEGTQFAGLLNYNRQDVKGFQAAGIVNALAAGLHGVHAAGVSNLVIGKTHGMQIAGAFNVAKDSVDGMQVAGVGNIALSDMKGTQIGGVFNYAKKIKGLQVGLVNLADTNLGTSIGLINLSNNGYRKLSFFANDVVNANVAIKTGNANLYTLLIAGKNYGDSAKVETLGVGFGHDFKFGKRVSIGAEMITQYIYLGNFDYHNMLMRFQGNLEIKLFKGLSIFGGPSYAFYNSNAPAGSSGAGYKQSIVPAKHTQFSG
ncbi:MAG: hypothetical protein EOO89_19230, partial [Pedobacter sp.]